MRKIHFIVSVLSLSFEVQQDFVRTCQPFWITSAGQRKVIRNNNGQRHFGENMSGFLVSNVHADGLALLGGIRAKEKHLIYSK